MDTKSEMEGERENSLQERKKKENCVSLCVCETTSRKMKNENLCRSLKLLRNDIYRPQIILTTHLLKSQKRSKKNKTSPSIDKTSLKVGCFFFVILNG